MTDTELPNLYEDAKEAGKRLAYWRKKRGMTQAELVARTTVSSKPYLSWMENGRAHAGRSEHFPSIAAALNLPVEEIKRFNPNLVLQVTQIGDGGANQEYITMPVYNMAAASYPQLNDAEPLEGMTIPVHASDFKSSTQLLRVCGHSMAKSNSEGILDRDVVAVDTNDVTVHPGRVYVVCVAGDGCTVKRARKLGDEIWLFSDNPDQDSYAPFKPDAASVFGRVYKVYRVPDVEL